MQPYIPSDTDHSARSGPKRSSGIALGFIGAGWWATTNHIPLLARRSDVTLTGVCRPDHAALQAIKQHFGFAFATEDYRELLDQDLDGVVISSPHHLHYEHAKAALERGLPVLCEKPIALEPAQAWELVALARERNLHLLVAYGWHYKPFIEEAKRLMDAGSVGQIEYALCHMASPTKELFSGAEGLSSEWTPLLNKPDPRTWQTKEQGGGYIHGQLTHSSALLFWLTGLRAERVSALTTAPNSAVDMYTAASVLFDGAAIGTISGAATLPDNDPFQVDVRIFGDKGVLLLDIERERLELRRHDGQHLHLSIEPGSGTYSCEGPPERFVELLQGHGTNNSPSEVAARSVELLSAICASAVEGGKPVNVYR